jgi:TrmH family RNA methyltransferase
MQAGILMEMISSRNNSKIKAARALRRRKERQESGAFLVEGIRHVGEAVDAGAPIEAIYYAPDLLDSQYGLDLVARVSQSGQPCYATTAEVFQSLAEKDNPQGILAVARQVERRLDEFNPANFPWGVALVSPQDPGNLGTILRTVDAVGASGLLALEDSVDAYHPAVVRASMGALFWRPLVNASFDDFQAWARRFGYHIYGSSAFGAVDYRQVESYLWPCVLLLGSERQGLSAEQAAVCERVVRLPMAGRATSLNLAVAAGVLLYDMFAKQGQ